MRLSTKSLMGAALLAAACLVSTAHAQTQAPRVRQGYSEADVRFMQGMIGHHAQALEMTRLVPTHTANPQLQLLARRIDVSQQDEIASMRRWLQDRGEAIPPAGSEHAGHDMAGMQHDMGGMSHDSASMHGMAGMDHAAMPGMATPEQLARLATLRGAEFDRFFLELMIRHHQGALTMVERLLGTSGAAQDPQTFGFASDVDADQRAEIARMERMLGASASSRP
jgi:uncharacterized protein (DUF305 family)